MKMWSWFRVVGGHSVRKAVDSQLDDSPIRLHHDPLAPCEGVSSFVKLPTRKALLYQRAVRWLANNALLSSHLCRHVFRLVEEHEKCVQVIEIVLPLPAGCLFPRVPLPPQFYIFIHIREEAR